MKLASAAFLLIALVSVASAQTTAPLGPGSGGGPGGGGGGASPAGATGTVQYNAGGGLFGGITNWKTSGTNDLTGSSGSTLAVNGCTIGSYAMCTAGTSNLIGAVTLGTQQTTQGSLVLANTAAGSFSTTIQSSNSATGAYTITLPVAAPVGNGYALTATTGGVASWSNIGAGPFLPLAGGTLTGTETISSASLILSGNQSAAAWTTSGIRYANPAVSYTDTSSSGTVAAAYTDIFGASTILASSATVYTQYYGAFFKAPVASTNVTMTNKSALGADTVSIGGAAQGSNALALTGTFAFSAGGTFGGDVSTTGKVTAGSSFFISGHGGIQSVVDQTIKLTDQSGSNTYVFAMPSGAATLQFGNLDTTTATAQTLRVQSVIAGTAAANGANWTLIGSLGTGTGTPGSVTFQVGVAQASGTAQSTATTALQLVGAANGSLPTVLMPGLANTATTSAVCYNTSTGLLTYDGTVGTCNTSTMRVKHDIKPLSDAALLNGVLKMRPVSFEYNESQHTPGTQFGLIAEDLANIDPHLVAYDGEGKPIAIQYLGPMFSYLIGAVKRQQAEIEQLKRKVH